MKIFNRLLVVAFLGSLPSSIMANTFMGSSWAELVCNAWNQEDLLTVQLMDDGNQNSWIENDDGRGYKLIQLYRTECGSNSLIQLNIIKKSNKAHCSYGGKPDGKNMNDQVDYLMHATTKNWTCAGEGNFGCDTFGLLLSGKIKFTGPKVEIITVKDSFDRFFKLTGEVPGDKESCLASNNQSEFDIDGDDLVKPLTDGLLILRHLFGFSDNALIANAVDGNATRTKAIDIQTYLQSSMDSKALDIDGDSTVKPLTDGLLVLRYLFGFTGDSLVNNAIGKNATRKAANDVEEYLQSKMP